MTEHTPTPWRLAEQTQRAEDQVCTHKIRTLDGDDYYSGLVAEADLESDAAFIVRACNAHDALVEALTDARKRLHSAALITGTDPEFALASVEKQDAALKLARGDV